MPIYTGCGRKNSPIWETNKFEKKKDTAIFFYFWKLHRMLWDAEGHLTFLLRLGIRQMFFCSPNHPEWTWLLPGLVFAAYCGVHSLGINHPEH
jgi:hypothetical protein